MRTTPNSAFFTKMQGDGFGMALLIDLETNNVAFHWTDADDKVKYTLSGDLTEYNPFPGQTLNGLKQSSDMQVSVIDFIMANTGSILSGLLDGYELDFATLKIGRCFIDTPDLGRMEIFQGKLGDYTYDRNALSGQVRNRWNSANISWPYYNYQDKCAWRFGSTGCGYNTSSITLTFSAGNIVVGSTTQLTILLASGTLTQSYSAGRFDFGRLTVTDGPNSGSIRTIRAHTGDQLGLSYNLPVNSFTTFGFSIFPGCKKRRIDDCRSLYNNDGSFLAWPWIPIQEQGF